MKTRALALCPPLTAENAPKVTPELLASTLARYSRSNRGIDSILESIDWNDPDRSVDAIFRFVDYGHASIAGMTGSIPVVIDGCSMFLAWKIFEIAQLCDGQESSTRYIKLDPSNLPHPDEIGIPLHLRAKWRSLMELSFRCYHELYETLDAKAKADPSIVRLPAGASEKVADRLRKNFALDRSRYYLPFATKTNAAYVMTARVWADTIKQLDALPLAEARACASALRSEVGKFAPRLLKHSFADPASTSQARQLLDHAAQKLRDEGLPTDRIVDRTFVSLDSSTPQFYPVVQTIEEGFAGKENRYSIAGPQIRRMVVRAAWNNMAIAELRDLNRHRSGYRFTPLAPVGFYLPGGIRHPRHEEFCRAAREFASELVQTDGANAYPYGLHLGTQIYFEHSMHLDKFIYETELRTGMGAHFRYAEHLSAACGELLKIAPQLAPFIQIGSAEPE